MDTTELLIWEKIACSYGDILEVRVSSGDVDVNLRAWGDYPEETFFLSPDAAEKLANALMNAAMMTRANLNQE